MKRKDIYLVIGIAALILAVFVGAVTFYKRSENAKLATQGSESADLSRLVRSDSPSMGPSLARVTVVEFLDPECEACRAVYPIVKKLLADYGGKVRLVVRYMPFHKNSVYAASALEAAGEQGKYWEALDLLFARQPEWASHHAPKPELIPELMKSLGLDMKRFHDDLTKPIYAEKVRRDQEDGAALGVLSTPSFFVNGRRLQGLGDAPLRELVDQALAR